TKVSVVDPTGNAVAVGAPVTNGAIVTQAVRATTTAGRYTVDWSVLSDDGHPVAGSFAFIVKRGTTAPSATASVDAAQTGGSNGLLWLVVATAGLVLLGCATALTRRYRSGAA